MQNDALMQRECLKGKEAFFFALSYIVKINNINGIGPNSSQ